MGKSGLAARVDPRVEARGQPVPEASDVLHPPREHHGLDGIGAGPRTEGGPFVEEALLEVVAVLGRVIHPAVYRLPDCALASPQLVAE